MNKTLSLKEIITCAVNALQAGVDSKDEAVDNIMSYVNEHYTNNEQLEEVPTELFEGVDKSGNRFRVAGVQL